MDNVPREFNYTRRRLHMALILSPADGNWALGIECPQPRLLVPTTDSVS